MKRNPLLLVSLLSLNALLTGCGGAPSVEEVRLELQHRFPHARFEREEHVHLGRISMAFVHGVMRLVPDAAEARDIVNPIHSVDMATYRVHGLPDLDRLTGETRFERQLARAGWSNTVRAREADGSRTWVFTRADSEGSLRNLFVVTFEGNELTLVRVDGRLDHAFAAAVAEHPKKALDGVGSGRTKTAEAVPAGQP
jgi:uncharacterized protein YecE (DUF72 family)